MIGQDVKLQRNGAYYDFMIDGNGIPLMTELGSTETADLLSFFGNQRASASQMPDLVRRNGWLGNLVLYNDFEYGNRNWLYYNARLTEQTANNIREETLNAFQWQVTDGFFKDILVEVEINYEQYSINVSITKVEIDNKRINRNFVIFFNKN